MELTPYTPSETARSFRKLSIFLSLGGILLVLIVAPIAHYAILLVGLFPLISSLLLALLISRLDKRGNPTKKVVVGTLDVLSALSYFGALVPVWIGRLRVSNGYRSYSNVGLAIPITYASSVYVAQIFLHGGLAASAFGFFKALANLLKSLAACWRGRPKKECSRCHECPVCRTAMDEQDQQVRPAVGPQQRRLDRGAAYSLLGDVADDNVEEETPRPSVEAQEV